MELRKPGYTVAGERIEEFTVKKIWVWPIAVIEGVCG